MKKQRFTMWVAALLIIAATVLPPLTAFAAADISSLAVEMSKQMTITTATGTVINPSSSGVYTNVPKDAKLLVHYAFSLPDNNGLTGDDYLEYDYNAGDYIDVQLPYAVSFEAPSGGWNVLDESNNVIGLLSIASDGVARITFTDYVETHSSIRGWFSLEGSFKDGVFDEGDPVQIDVVFAGTIVTIGFKEDGDPLSVSTDKNGVYDAASNKITWTVIVTPNKSVIGISVVDTFSNNQTYVPGSFKRGEVSVDDGDLTITPGTTTTEIRYSGLALDAATTFTYQTEPTSTAFTAETGSDENVVFSNGVDIYKDETPFAHDDARVTINWIQKTGSVTSADSRLIKWTVTVDAGGYDISGCTLTDTIPKDLALYVDATHPVRFGTTDLTEAVLGGAEDTYTYEAGADDTHILTLYLGSVTTFGTLTFYTRVTDEAYYKINGTTTLTNRIEMDWEENHSGNPWDSAGVNVGLGLIYKSGDSDTAIDFDDDTTNPINWTVRINRNQIPISDAMFSDIIPAGLEYVDGSFSIDHTGGTFDYDDTTKELQYDFGGTISTNYTIMFQTRITDYAPLYVNQDNISGYTNTATLTGGGMAETSVSSMGRQRYNSEVIAKTVQKVDGVDYDHTTRRVTWQIVVNRNDIPLYDAVVTDTIPAGMTFLPETFQVEGVASPVTDALVYTVNPAGDTTSHDTFSYTFPATYSDVCTITYQTEVKQAALLTQGTKSFSNTSHLTATGLSASATAVASMNNTMVVKSIDHVTGADYAGWKIVINGEGITMTDIDVSDVLQEGLELDPESVKLYPMTLAVNGMLTRGDTPVSTSLYEVTYDETTRKLTLRIPGTINGPYQLEFITDIMVSSLAINNTVTLNGTSYIATSDVDDVTVVVSETGLGGTGVQGSITIEKVGESGEPLSGAVFTLYNNRGVIVAQDETDETGAVTFGDLPIRTYVLEETTAPEGHVRSEETVRFRMDTEAPNVFYQFADEKIRADVVILKTGVDDVPLSGAEFSLYDSDSNLVAVRTTDANGKATFEDLVYGSYTIVETKAPSGYVRAEDSIPIVVSSVDEIDLTIPNVRYDIPQTGGWVDTWSLLALGGVLVLAGTAWLLMRKRRVHVR